MDIRVDHEATYCSGVVYYANYLEDFERALIIIQKIADGRWLGSTAKGTRVAAARRRCIIGRLPAMARRW